MFKFIWFGVIFVEYNLVGGCFWVFYEWMLIDCWDIFDDFMLEFENFIVDVLSDVINDVEIEVFLWWWMLIEDIFICVGFCFFKGIVEFEVFIDCYVFDNLILFIIDMLILW